MADFHGIPSSSHILPCVVLSFTQAVDFLNYGQYKAGLDESNDLHVSG
jgi:hypothetical protein